VHEFFLQNPAQIDGSFYIRQVPRPPAAAGRATTRRGATGTVCCTDREAPSAPGRTSRSRIRRATAPGRSVEPATATRDARHDLPSVTCAMLCRE
jgi:hypothetical protein